MARANHLLRSLLNRIPETQRKDAVRDAVKVIDSQNHTTVEFALDVLSACPDEDSKIELVERLKYFIHAGHLDVAIFASRHDEGIKDELLRYTLMQLHRLAGIIQRRSQTLVAVHLGDHVTARSNNETDLGLESLTLTDDSLTLLQPLLTYLKMLIEPDTSSQHTKVVLETVLPLLGVSEEQAALAARDVIYKFIKSTKILSQNEITLIWARIRHLIASILKTFHANLGYAIWLRCVTLKHAKMELCFDAEYWRLLRMGLQTGDGERRKQCLEILRSSVLIAAKESHLHPQICSKAIIDGCESPLSTFTSSVVSWADAHLRQAYPKFFIRRIQSCSK